MPLNKDIKKVLVIGSGPIVIGQAAEFDYAGAQACRVLKDAGLDVVLVNSNPATIMTDNALADEIYLEPLTQETVKRIIEKEHPDSILAGLGGQTGLTIAMQLAQNGYLEKMGVKLLGTNAEAIDKAEDRQLFRDTMLKIGQPVVPSDIANTVERAAEIAQEIGYPVIIRPAFTLGGAGGGVVYNEEELRVIAYNGLELSPINQILVERFIGGWKEIEFEVMRDSVGNVIAVCSMENFDPVGVHTGDSIVIAPAVTLSDKEYQMLRSASLDIITELGIEGGCNCQFALNPESFEYSVIEVNPRVSRSSALASKATGYPIAKVTTKIALGYTLDEIRNDITGKTCACFEPTLDYVVVKFPKWPFDKFVGASRKLGTQMKATGEVMSIAPSFEMAVMKAVRGAEISLETLNYNKFPDDMDVVERLHEQDDLRIFTVFKALKEGISIEKIHEITMIDEWFLGKLKNLVDYEKMLESGKLDKDYYEKGKKYGYKDSTILKMAGKLPEKTLDAVYKMVDTCGAEFKAETPYFYSTYDSDCESREIERGEKERIIVLGSGPIRIGQGVEFDYSTVHAIQTIKNAGYEAIIINNNPETVSTDYTTSDKLYFEPLTVEDVMNVVEQEKPEGVIASLGGQTAINLAQPLTDFGVNIIGTDCAAIEKAENRDAFEKLLISLNIPQPKGKAVTRIEDGVAAAREIGYPVLVRPSFVLGGRAMQIVANEEQLRHYLHTAVEIDADKPVLVDKYIRGKEVEIDAICDGTDVFVPGIMELVERTGVHSGDSISVYPSFSISNKVKGIILQYAKKLGPAIGIKGLYNIQFIVDPEDHVYIIEVNPRSSRTVPFLSKATGYPLADIATLVALGQSLKEQGIDMLYPDEQKRYYAKAPAFSFSKLRGLDAYLSPEMKSTGEAIGYDNNLTHALYKAMQASGMKLENYGTVFVTISDEDKEEALPLIRRFYRLGFNIEATVGTAVFLRQHGIRTRVRAKVDDGSDEILNSIRQGYVTYVINTMDVRCEDVHSGSSQIRRCAVENGVTMLTALDTVRVLLDVLEEITLGISTIDA